MDKIQLRPSTRPDPNDSDENEANEISDSEEAEFEDEII